ncbi:MAG: hypothetical protein RL226_486 [Bacteroidota bacterium]|jgi:16S rRNA (guanine(966)-N(2))-methyltransferase RsmD
MRIIGGSHKGRRFNPPASYTGRPTTDYARESLFNILHHRYDVRDAMVLDLFAGVGSVSYEFASRGAARVTAIEQDVRAVKFISQTATSFGLSAIAPLRGDVFNWLKTSRAKWDVVFADPPYDLEKLTSLPEMVKACDMLNPDGLFILEHGPDHSFADHEHCFDERKYGHVHFSFFNFEQP